MGCSGRGRAACEGNAYGCYGHARPRVWSGGEGKGAVMFAGRRFGVGVVVMLVVGALAVPAVAGDGDHLWTRQFGTSQEDWVRGVAAHPLGVYAAGVTEGSLQGANKGWSDGFVRKYGRGGKLLWTRQFGTPQEDWVLGVAVHATGVYAAGYTWGSLQGSNKGLTDGFVRKYGHDGKHLWTRQFGTPEVDFVVGVAVDAGGVYVVGSTSGSLQGTNKGGSDGFVRKYDHDGKHLWTRQFGTPEWDYVRGVAAHAGGVYAAGYTWGSLQGANKGQGDGFVCKYGRGGKHLWTRQFGTPQGDSVFGVAVNATGVYVAGPTEGSLQGTNKGYDDGFVRKYDHDGKHLWTRQFGTPEWDEVSGVAVDATGVYAAGRTDGSLQGTNKGWTDGFVRKYDHDGKHLWTRQFGTPTRDYVEGVAVHAGGVYAAGYTWGSLQGTSKGGSDGFVRKYGTG